ncbi:MAG: hypothetical protein ACFHXK_10245 [bacterium]
MSTENNSPESDNEIPPVARLFGRAVSEWVVYSFILFSVIAVIFGAKVGGERDAQAERAMATLAALTEVAEKQAAAGKVLICDNTLLDAELLANDYLQLSIRKAPFDEDNKSLGYGPALHISVVEKEVSGDTWDTAQRLMELVEEAGEEDVRASEDRSGRILAANVASGEDKFAELEEVKEPRNRLREVRKKSFGEDENFLRYYILASEVAVCGQGA